MIRSGQLLRFDNNVNNRYKSTFRNRNIQSNPSLIRKYTKVSTKSNDTVSPKVTVTATRPVKNKITNTEHKSNPTNNIRYNTNKIVPKKNITNKKNQTKLKPSSLVDVILNMGRRINAENQNKRLYDRFGNYIKK